MRKAPKVMPSTAPSPSPRSAGGGTHTRGRQHGDTVPKPPYGSSQPQTHCWVASRRPSRSPPKPSRRWCCSAHGEGWGELGDSPAPPPPPRCHHPTGTGLGTPIPRGSVAPGRCPQLGAGDGWLGTPAGTPGRGCHTDLQPGLALEGGGEGDVAALGDGVGEAESPNLPGPAAGGLLQHGHAGALRLVGLHQQQRLPPRCHQPALLQLQVGRVVVPAHGGLRGRGHGVTVRDATPPGTLPAVPGRCGTCTKASLLTSSSVCGTSKAAVGKRRRKSSRGIWHWKAT